MDVLGIGAVEATKEDYFLFKVLRVRLKQVIINTIYQYYP